MADKRNPKNDEMDDAVELDIDDETASSESPGSDDLSKLEAALAKLKNDYLYLGAEFDNYKKQAIKERSDLVRFGSERFIRDFLGVFDNFERALSTPTNAENESTLRTGVEMIQRELQSLLTRHGVVEINPVGQPFDPNTQEAISSEPTDAVPPGNVSRVFRKAYRLHDRLLRPAQVVVATTPTAPVPPKEGEE